MGIMYMFCLSEKKYEHMYECYWNLQTISQAMFWKESIVPAE